MTVIAFPPRRPLERPNVLAMPVPVSGTFRSPSGRRGHMEGSLRIRRLVVLPGGTFVAGVCTGRLFDHDGSPIGVDSRRVTIRSELVRMDSGYAPAVRPFDVELMGLTVHVPAPDVARLPILRHHAASGDDRRPVTQMSDRAPRRCPQLSDERREP